MPVYEEPWDKYSATYNTEAEEDVLVVTFPDNHRLDGPAGTLIGFTDLVRQVLKAVDKERAGPITGHYRWPPSGIFVSTTGRMDAHGPLGRYLHLDWNDRDRVWNAQLQWIRDGEDWYNSVSANLYVWRPLADALNRLLEHDDVRRREEESALRAD